MDEAATFTTAVAGEHLLVQRCTDCGGSSLPPSAGCPRCGSADVELVPAATGGHLLTWTVCHVAFDPAFADQVPYTVALVELDDGARLLGRLDATDVRAGMAVDLCWTRSPVDDEPVWAFRERPS